MIRRVSELWSDSRPRTALLGAAILLLAAASFAVGANLKGTSGPDGIKGTQKGDRIIGRGGDDLLKGRRGRDRVRGGGGNDRLVGGPGRDKIKGGAGDDTIHGSKGTDKLFGGKGRDGFNVVNGVLKGSPGNDVIRARDGEADEIDCDRGFDTVYVDNVEDGVYNCEKVIGPGKEEIGEHEPPEEEG